MPLVVGRENASQPTNIYQNLKSQKLMTHAVDKYFRRKEYHEHFIVEHVEGRGGTGSEDSVPYIHVLARAAKNRAVRLDCTISRLDLGADQSKWDRVLKKKADDFINKAKLRVGRRAQEKTLAQISGEGATLVE